MTFLASYFDCKESEFAEHSFLQALTNSRSIATLTPYAHGMSLWVMAFQDLLALNSDRMESPELLKLVEQHRREDSGHDRWFIEDMKLLTGQEPSLRSTYSPESKAARRATYAILAEAAQLTTDYERIIFLLTLESAAHVFFDQVAAFVTRVGYAQKLKYFSGVHLDAEEGHESLHGGIEAYAETLELSFAQWQSAFAMVDRVYAAFDLMFTPAVAAKSTTAKSTTAKSSQPLAA